MTRGLFIPISEEMLSEGQFVRDFEAEIADRMAHPRCQLPDDHPARLPASSAARWAARVDRRLRDAERRMVRRLYDRIADRYDFEDGA